MPRRLSSGALPERRFTIKKKILAICIAAIAFLFALGVTLYPIISTRYNEIHQSEIHTEYQEVIEQTDNSALLAARKNAEAYNKTIQPGTQLTDAFSRDALLSASEDYTEQLNLAGDGIMGYVRIPVISVHLPIYHGTDEMTLAIGIGHLLGSSLPVGGANTHAILTAHSGMATQKLFSDLPQMEIGDVFYLEVLNETLAYQVDQIETVLPYDTSFLGVEAGNDLCTLVTCTPFGINTHRLLVRGSRIPYEQAEVIVEETIEEELPVSTWEQQYLKGIYIGLAAVFLMILIALIIWICRRYRHARH